VLPSPSAAANTIREVGQVVAPGALGRVEVERGPRARPHLGPAHGDRRAGAAVVKVLPYALGYASLTITTIYVSLALRRWTGSRRNGL
jgi:hypothetical protein